MCHGVGVQKLKIHEKKNIISQDTIPCGTCASCRNKGQDSHERNLKTLSRQRSISIRPKTNFQTILSGSKTLRAPASMLYVDLGVSFWCTKLKNKRAGSLAASHTGPCHTAHSSSEYVDNKNGETLTVSDRPSRLRWHCRRRGSGSGGGRRWRDRRSGSGRCRGRRLVHTVAVGSVSRGHLAFVAGDVRPRPFCHNVTLFLETGGTGGGGASAFVLSLL